MATLVKTGIGDGQTLTPVMITELYDAFTGDKLFDNIVFNNSMKVTHDGQVAISRPGASKATPYALNVVGDIQAHIGRFNQVISDTMTFVTSSGLIVSGSNHFGGLDTHIHTFTGSLAISGSQAISNYFLNKVAIGREDVQGVDMLEVQGSIKASGAITGSEILVTNLNVTGDATIEGNLTFGNADTDSVSFVSDISSSLIPDGDSIYNIGHGSKRWNNAFVTSLDSENSISTTTIFSNFVNIGVGRHLYLVSDGAQGIISGSGISSASFGRMQIGGDLDVYGSASFAHMQFNDFVSIDTASISSLQVGLNKDTGSDNQLLRTDGFGKISYDYADRTSIIGRNESGGTMSAGTAVYISTYHNNNIYSIDNARNDTPSKNPAVGLVKNTLSNFETGSVVLSGMVRSKDLDTSGFSAGTKVFLGTIGSLVSPKPTAPGVAIQQMGVVLKSSATNGEILVLAGGGGGATEVLRGNHIFLGSGVANDTLHLSGALDRSTLNNITASGNVAVTGTGSFGRVIAQNGRFSDLQVTDDMTITDDFAVGGVLTATGGTILGNTVSDTHTIVGHITSSGNISSSITSTGSIGHLHIANNIGVGTESPLSTVHISGSDGIIIPVGTSAQRSSNAIKGEIRFNTTTQTYEGYDGNNWGSLGGMTDVDQDTKITSEDSAGVDNDELKFFTAGSERLRILADGHISASGNISSSANLKINGTGSLTRVESTTLSVNTPLTSSTAIFTNNIQNGYPISNAWQSNLEGSFFNNFDNTTHVSEILRFMAGVISHSIDTAAPTPNTKFWNTVSTSHTAGSTTSKGSLLNGVLGTSYENARLSQHWTGSSYIDLSETGSYRKVQDYLQLKGFVQSSDRGTFGNDTGTNPFHGSYASRIPSTILTNGTFDTNTFTITANAGGSSVIFSNSNFFGMGGLTNGGATPYTVKIAASASFSDNYSDSIPDKTSTFHTSSVIDYTISSFGTSNGLTLAKIETAQPAVIPAAFQDGDFNSVSGPLSGRFHHTGSVDQNTISASGYYKTDDIKVGLKTGSMSDFQYKDGTDGSTVFYLYTGDLPSDITDGAPTPSISKDFIRTGFSATSRSLSGAPYLLTTTYGFTYSARATNCFDPCYGHATSPLVNSKPTDTWDNIGSTSLSNSTVSVTNSGVQSTGASTYVISSDFTTKRTSNQIPHITDVSVASSSFSFSLDSNSSNVVSARSTQQSLNYSLTFRTTARNWKNSSTTSTTSTISFYDASLFGQGSSGSMAVYSRAQGYDANTLVDSTETFTGEDFRIILADNVQAFNGAYFTTNSYKTNDNGDAVLGNFDLQVKPGFLVDPGGTRGYWFKSGFGSGTYKYYIRRFQKTSSGTKTSMTLNLGTSLVAWNSTSNGVAAVILFESSGNGSGNNVSLGRARIYDPTATTSNVIETNISNDNHKNPFSTAIDLYGNTGGGLSSTTYTIPIRNADGMFLDDSDNELYVLVRYKGDPSPITSITLGYS